MAEIVLGIATSHSPMLLAEPIIWLERGRQDKTNPLLRDFDGTKITYDEVLARVNVNEMRKRIEPDLLETQHQANQRAIAKIADVLADANPDLVVVIGDDHHEVFHDDNMPALSVYWGNSIPYKPQGPLKWYFTSTPRSELWYHTDEREYPVASTEGLRLIEHLLGADFDPAHARLFRDGQGMSHSFGYYYRKVAQERRTPIIPVSVNTYFPPNQMPPGRAYRLGREIRKAIESWPEAKRVAVVATGGLSHFLVDEELDKRFLDMISERSLESHANFPIEKLQSGNSELRCWSAVAGAVDHMDMTLVDYVPCYRSEAGTGCGMAFAYWS